MCDKHYPELSNEDKHFWTTAIAENPRLTIVQQHLDDNLYSVHDIEYVDICNGCNAVTVGFENQSSSKSFPLSKWNQHFTIPPPKEFQNKYSCCNYCVNNWGTDLCRCGSGIETDDCGCNYNESYQSLYTYEECE